MILCDSPYKNTNVLIYSSNVCQSLLHSALYSKSISVFCGSVHVFQSENQSICNFCSSLDQTDPLIII